MHKKPENLPIRLQDTEPPWESAMAAEFTAQLQDPSFRALSFEDKVQ